MANGNMQGSGQERGAALIDSVLTLLITLPLLVAIYGWSYVDLDHPGLTGGPADFLISWVLPAVAVITFWVMKQATPGKMAFSARIVDAASGQPASVGQLVGRYFAYFVSAVPLCLGFLWVAFDRRKRGWHDKLAGTVVVRQQVQGKRPLRSLLWIVVIVIACVTIVWIGGFASEEGGQESAVKVADIGQSPANEYGTHQHRGPVEPAVAQEPSVPVPAPEKPAGNGEKAMPPIVSASVAISSESDVVAIPTVEKTAFVPASRKAYPSGDLRHCLDHHTNEKIVRCVEH